MTSDVYDNALKIKEKLLVEIAKVDEFLKLYREFSGTNDENHDTVMHSTPVPDAVEDHPKRKKNRGTPQVIADSAERMIRAAGRPLVRTEVAEKLEASGIEIPSEDKARYIGTILWRRKDKFESIDGEGYWIRGVPRPRADVQAMLD